MLLVIRARYVQNRTSSKAAAFRRTAERGDLTSLTFSDKTLLSAITGIGAIYQYIPYAVIAQLVAGALKMTDRKMTDRDIAGGGKCRTGIRRTKV